MLKELTLEGEIDKVKIACNRLRLHEPPEGYYVAFSGGKDSCVVLDLCKRAMENRTDEVYVDYVDELKD